ncbi:MAG: ATP-binding protein [Nocardioides sp.]
MTDTATTASSGDGRTFFLDTPDEAPYLPGDLVVLRPAGLDALLGQLVEPGGGLLVAALGADGTPSRVTSRDPFRGAPVDPVQADHLEALQRSADARLSIGTWTVGDAEAPARLRPQGFGRHTFLCGQSGSGKTYALGVILEQLLLGTDLRMVVLDPNADFVRLGEVLPGASPEDQERLASQEVRVLGATATGEEPLRLRFATLPRRAQAAVLRLDPLADREEYNLLLQQFGSDSPPDLGALLTRFRTGEEAGRSLAQRVENLGLTEWEVFAGADASAAEIVASGPRVTVLDLGGFADPAEPPALSLDMIENLWAQRQTRTPTLIVVDEAHNLCPAEPVGPVQKALVERFIQIAGEGRKYGLWLLLSTQRPSKLHPQVLSQCDNLVLMRMNSPGDVAELADVFGFAPPAMIAAAPQFVQGEALVAGGFVPRPAFIRMGGRLTRQGGSDVAVPVG